MVNLTCGRYDFFHESFFIENLSKTIVTEPKNANETVNNVKVVSFDSFK